MKIKVIQTTDGKYEGQIFEVDELTHSSVKEVTSKDFDFNFISYINTDTIKMQSSNYTAIIKIIQQ